MKTGLTVEEHTEVARALADILDRMTRPLVLVAGAVYPHQREARALERAFLAVNEARRLMDERFAREHADSLNEQACAPAGNGPS